MSHDRQLKNYQLSVQINIASSFWLVCNIIIALPLSFTSLLLSIFRIALSIGYHRYQFNFGPTQIHSHIKPKW